MNGTSLTPSQVEVLNMMSFVDKSSTFERLKDAIADFFAKQLDEEISQMWKDGSLDEEKIESFRNLHERTPYK